MKTILTILLCLTISQGHTTQRGDLLRSINNDKISIFVNRHYEAAQQLYKDSNIPMAISLSQWILESKYGTHKRAIETNNLGGIMTKRKLRNYESIECFYEAYEKVLNQKCYRDIDRDSIFQWVDALSYPCCTYATSRSYKRKLLSIIFKYGLDKLV